MRHGRYLGIQLRLLGEGSLLRPSSNHIRSIPSILHAGKVSACSLMCFAIFDNYSEINIPQSAQCSVGTSAVATKKLSLINVPRSSRYYWLCITLRVCTSELATRAINAIIGIIRQYLSRYLQRSHRGLQERKLKPAELSRRSGTNSNRRFHNLIVFTLMCSIVRML